MKKILCLLLLSVCFSCNKKKVVAAKITTIEKPYIISEFDKKFKENTDSLNKNGSKTIVLQKKGFYGENNLLIDLNGDFFFFQKEYLGFICGTGRENDTLPEFLDLHPKDLIKVPKESLEKFVYENVMIKPEKRKILVIASQNDSIKDKDFLKFYYNIKVPIYIIRRTTQEEDSVLYYKKNNEYYFSDQIKWDKTKIKLRD